MFLKFIFHRSKLINHSTFTEIHKQKKKLSDKVKEDLVENLNAVLSLCLCQLLPLERLEQGLSEEWSWELPPLQPSSSTPNSKDIQLLFL